MSSYLQMQIVKQFDAEFSFTKIKYSIKVTLLNAHISWKWKFEQWDTWQLNRINQEKIIEWLFYVNTLMMFHFDQIRGSKKLE